MTTPKLLIVDDHQENLTVLVEILSPNYVVRVANNGRRGLQLATDDPPDLILLDIMMPGMSGFEVCEELKKAEHLAEIPVIFISAADDVDSKVRAFQTGGVDYVSKPFQAEELESRISTHLSLRSLQQQLEDHNRKLDQQVKEKSAQLAEAYERLTIVNSTKNEFLELIAHELRTPANGVIGLAEMMLDNSMSQSDIDELRPLFYQSRDRMVETLDNALLLARIHVTQDEFQSGQISLANIFERIQRAVQDFAQRNGVGLSLPSGGAVYVSGDEALLTRAFENLFKTAIKFGQAGTVVDVDLVTEKEAVTIKIKSSGVTLEEGVIANFFDVFSSVRSYTYAEELGLNPAVAERIFTLYGGSLQVDNCTGQSGVVFTLKLLKA